MKNCRKPDSKSREFTQNSNYYSGDCDECTVQVTNERLGRNHKEREDPHRRGLPIDIPAKKVIVQVCSPLGIQYFF